MSNHPLSKAFAPLEAPFDPSDVTELAGKGLVGIVDGKRLVAGNALLLEDQSITCSPRLRAGGTILLAVDGVHLASYHLYDEPRPGAQALVEYRERGVQTW